MKKTLIYLSLIFCLVFNSCGEPKEYVIALIKISFVNNTNKEIKLIPYNSSVIMIDSIKVLPPNSIIQIENVKYNITTQIAKSFLFKYLNNTDSIIISFDGIKKEKHRNKLTNPINLPFLPNVERSIYTNDGGAYKQNIIEDRKNYYEAEYTYTFIEQDYLDAEFIK